ncbi:TolC family protein [Aquimarina sp. 2201CG1-2-11]|uniref:TolC family protein n=1 Tax=Aquimarina discodermiae TaxID=3231043 RepID=UPI00346308ED
MKNIKIMIGFLLVSFFAKGQQLQSYIQEAQSNNPKIKAYELRYDIAQEKISEGNRIPNTEFGVGYFISEPETRTGAQVARFSVKQMLPWFGTVSARQKYATAMAQTEYVDYVVAKRKLGLIVAQSYYKLHSLQEKQNIVDKNIQLLKTYEKLALQSIEVAKASAIDVLRLQIRQNELLQQKEILQEQFIAEQANFNSLLNRDTNLSLPKIPKMELPNADLITMDSLQLNPELLRYDKMYESVIQAELLNQKESAPVFGVGLDYIPVQAHSQQEHQHHSNVADNGKDVVMPMVSLSIPLFNKRYNSRTKQNELRKQEINLQKQERLNGLKSALAKAVSQRNKARITFNSQTKNLKQAKDAEQILIKNYETGTIDFNDVLDIQELQLKFELNQIQSVQLYHMQSAMINYIINK